MVSPVEPCLVQNQNDLLQRTLAAIMSSSRVTFNFLRAIDVFAAVIETRHFSVAADMQAMTQSAG
jgi:hypothetical protein